eukprot:jgi/Undpi1/7477/HiC_scaffold_22.g09950.m1
MFEQVAAAVMSSDEEQEGAGRRGGRMAFTDQNDFEGGRWINGEYYYENQRKGQTQTEDDRILGVFQDGSSDEDDNGGRKGKKKGGRKKQALTKGDHGKPMSFVADKATKGSGGGGGNGSAALRKKSGGRSGRTDAGVGDGDSDNIDGDDSDSAEEENESPTVTSARRQTQQQFREHLNAVSAERAKPAPPAAPIPPAPPHLGDRSGLGAATTAAAAVGGAAGMGAGARAGEVPSVPAAADTRSNADFRALLGKAAATPPPPPPPPPPPQPPSSVKEAVASSSAAGLGARGGLGLGAGGGLGLGMKGGLGAAAGKGVGEGESQEAEKKKTLPAKLDAGFGGWEKNTKGIGKKLLMKMGFKGRLGKNEDGVTRQLEVKVRPGLSGLGFGNFKEATTLKVNREIEADRQGKTLEQMEAEMGLAAASGGRFVTPEELLKSQEEEAAEKGEIKPPPKQIIVDMRGPQAKLVSSMDDLAPMATGAGDGTSPKLGQELLHNVGLMVGLAETEIQASDAADLQKKVDDSGERLSRLENVETILFKVHDKVVNDPAAVTADHVLRAFRTLRQRFPEEYAVFGLAQLVPAMAAPVIKRSLAGWSPLQAPTEPANLLASWKDVLTDTSGAEEGEGRARRWEGQAAFEFLANELVLPAVRSALINEWEVRDPTPALTLAEALVTAGVGDEIVQSLLMQAILPKLTRGVTEWEPRTDTVLIHTWIHPWLPLLGSHVAGVFPEIRRKLAAALVHWDPSDATAYVMLKPWKNVFDYRSMEALLDKCIAPKLVAGLRKTLIINPSNQDMAPFNMLMMWADLIPPLYMTSILDVEFFPKWLTVLHRWLSDTADYAEVALWYQGWKDRFPEVLRSDPRVMAQFSAALTLMDQVMQDHQQQGVPLPAGASEQMDYIRVVERRRMEAATLHQQQLQQQQLQQQHMRAGAAAAGGVGTGPITASFRDVVESFAEANGVMFLPKPGRQHEGKQASVFAVNCFLLLLLLLRENI